jgi:alpha-D-ribose 1-methylphosphonate 5-triphosphate synthase subunit PhnH
LAGSDAAAWLRFHTGCSEVADVAQAQFIWVGQGDALPQLHNLRQGSDACPDQSATCVIEVHNLHADEAGWRLQGPGILGERTLRVQGLAADFPNQWSRNHAGFPCGVDVFLVTATQIVGLPRTTRILAEES